jgi:cation transport ATPase
VDKKGHIEKIVKNICTIFSLAFIITLILYLVLNFFFRSKVYYLGIATIVLLFPFLSSIAYVMAVSAKRAIDKGIEKNEEELKRRIAETSAEEKENNK